MGRGLDLSIPLNPAEASRLLARLEAGSDKTGSCWLWLGYRRNGHHGAISVHDHPVYVHQLSYSIHVGPIPQGRVIRHSCDVPSCWRPEHLLLGDHSENVADKMARRRHRYGVTRGIANHNATLTDDQVAEVRRRWAAGGVRQRDLAAHFGVAQSTIWRLVHRLTR